MLKKSFLKNKCPICLKERKNHFKCSKCLEIFCYNCIAKYPKCPLCDNSLNLNQNENTIDLNLAINDIISQRSFDNNKINNSVDLEKENKIEYKEIKNILYILLNRLLDKIFDDREYNNKIEKYNIYLVNDTYSEINKKMYKEYRFIFYYIFYNNNYDFIIKNYSLYNNNYLLINYKNNKNINCQINSLIINKEENKNKIIYLSKTKKNLYYMKLYIKNLIENLNEININILDEIFKEINKVLEKENFNYFINGIIYKNSNKNNIQFNNLLIINENSDGNIIIEVNNKTIYVKIYIGIIN